MRTKTAIIALFVVLGLLVSGNAWAKVSAEEAGRLGKGLTPFGAEKAGNADGTIPAWDGGLTKIPEGITYPGGGALYPDPFKDDKVLFSIDAGNVDKYADKLPESMVAMMKKYPSYRIDVYPTSRTAAAPQWVYDNTKKNATLCALTEDKLGVLDNGGHGGIPFPIPQRGEEVIYNSLLRWSGDGFFAKQRDFVIFPNGKRSLGGGGPHWEEFTWYNVKPGEEFNGMGGKGFGLFTMPARRKGEAYYVEGMLNQSKFPRRAWQYLPGQRRVRRAPSIGYDTPYPGSAGISNYDDGYGFNGGLDRYDWKLVGKKEMYIPYNCYSYDLATLDQVLTPLHINPDFMRWELHRVWVVEATLRKDKRHPVAKRQIYVDEDSWMIAAVDQYDGRGILWKGYLNQALSAYDLPGYVFRSFVMYDLTREVYYSVSSQCGLKVGHRYDIVPDPTMFTIESLRRSGRR